MTIYQIAAILLFHAGIAASIALIAKRVGSKISWLEVTKKYLLTLLFAVVFIAWIMIMTWLWEYS